MRLKGVLSLPLFLIAVTVSSTTSEETDWPQLIVVEQFEDRNEKTVFEFNPNNGDTSSISMPQRLHRGLAANAYSDTICHFHRPTYGIVCYQKRTAFIPDIPRSNYEKLKEPKNNLMSLSPFGDHLIWQEVNLGGIWIMNLKTEKSRLLIKSRKNDKHRYPFMEVDWDNGYLLALPLSGESGIEVWELLGDSGAKLVNYIHTSGDVSGMTIDVKTLTVYWIMDTNIRKASYDNSDRGKISEQLVFRHNFSTVAVDTLRYYQNGLFWAADAVQPLRLPIYRYDLRTKTVGVKSFPSMDGGGSIYKMAVFEEDEAGAKNRSNACSKCSHICIPRRGSGYECTCPFGRRLANATACERPLKVWAIGEEKTSVESTRYFQTYDAMAGATDSNPTTSTGVKRTSTIIPQPEGYCYSMDSSLGCFNDTGGFLGTEELGARTLRVLAVTWDEAVYWFEGNCVRHRANWKAVWTLYCDPMIDAENVVLDTVNWHLFYRNRGTGNLMHVDLVSRSETVMEPAEFSTTEQQPMRLAVDASNQILYYLAAEVLCEVHYDPELSEAERSDHKVIFDLDPRNFKSHDLRYIEGVLYWVETRHIPPNPEEDFVVKFDIETETQETLVKAASGFSLSSFDVQVPRTTSSEITCFNRSHGCSHFCRGNIDYSHCWCPEELPVLEGGNCTGVELIAAVIETDRRFSSGSTKIKTIPASKLTTNLQTIQQGPWPGFSYTGEVGRLCWIEDFKLYCKTANNDTELTVPGAQNVTMIVPKACNKDEVYWLSQGPKGDLCLFMWTPNFESAINLKLCPGGRPSAVTFDTFRKTLFWCGVFGGRSQLHWQTLKGEMSTEVPNVIHAPDLCTGLAVNEYQSKLFIAVGGEIQEYFYDELVVVDPKDSSPPVGVTVHNLVRTNKIEPGTLRYHDGYILWTSATQNGGQFVNLLHRFDAEYTSKPYKVFEAHRQDRVLQVEMLNSHQEPMTLGDPCKDHLCPFLCYPSNPFPEVPKAHQCYCPPGHEDVCQPDAEASMSLKTFFLWFTFMVAIFAIINIIGFIVYKKHNEVKTNYEIRKFKYGDPERALGAQDDAARALHLPFSNLLDPSSVKIYRNKRLGEGNFGEVCEGEYDGRRVAIKTLKDDLDFNTLQAFFRELKIMAYVGKHENIVELIGADISGIYGGKVRAILEFCSNGSLDEYLKKHRNAVPQGCVYQNQNANENTLENPTYIFGGGSEVDSTLEETSFSLANTNTAIDETLFANPKTIVPLLCHWSYQISRAMAFLTAKRVVHGDLATRNVLVFDDNILKVTDFGLSRNMYQKAVYESRNRSRALPWKWAAPETLEDFQFSFMSDVWSYGVTLWEIFTFAKTPYPNRVWDLDFVRELKDGSLRLPRPELMPSDVYNGVLLRCFETVPEARIDFANIEQFWIRYFTPEPRTYVNSPA